MQDDKLVSVGYKVTQENREKLQNLMKELDLSGDEFMETMISSFEADNKREYVAFAKEDYSALQKYTKSIDTLFVSMGQKLQVELDSNTDGFNELLSEKDDNINNQLEQIVALKEQRNELLESVKQYKEEAINLVSQISELTESNDTLKQLNEALTRDSNKLLEVEKKNEELLGKQTESDEKLGKLRKEVSDLGQANDTLTNDKSTLEGKVAALEEEHDEFIDSLGDKYKDDLERLADRLNIKCRDSVLAEKEKRMAEKEKRIAMKEEMNELEKELSDLKTKYEKVNGELSVLSLGDGVIE